MEILQRLPKIILILCLHAELIHAQVWTKADSLWLDNVLSGKDTIRLNPEFQKAIKGGTLINPGVNTPSGTMRMAPAPVPILKDFSEYITKEEDTIKQGKVAWKDLPPSMFLRYFEAPEISPYKRRNLKSTYVPDWLKQSGKKPTGISFGDMLDYVFSPSARERIENRKREGTWKNYNNLPTPDIHRKQRKLLKDHPELLIPVSKKDSLQVVPNLESDRLNEKEVD